MLFIFHFMFGLVLNWQSFKLHFGGLVFKSPLINQSICNFFYAEFYVIILFGLPI